VKQKSCFSLLICAITGLATAADTPKTLTNVEWPTYNGTLAADRFSSLDSITPENVADLREACEVALGDEGTFESGPVVIGDTLYITTSHTTLALDAATCAIRWRSRYVPESEEPYPVNRGVAYMDDRLYRGTTDGQLLAIDAVTGKELWRVHPPAPNASGFFSAAPIAWNGLVFIGPAASESGIRGYVAAFEAATGNQVWRFDTVPMGDEPGAQTWRDPTAAIHGGGSTWSSYALDPIAGELFVPVANPAPDFSPNRRLGDNLYTDSLVVLDAKTGTLKWYYQLTPNDGFDYDLGATPMLYTDQDGRRRVALASKDGNVYVLDRDTHKLMWKTPVTTIFNADKRPTPEGVRVCPGTAGGVEWNGPAFSPNTRDIYVGSVDWCYVVKSAEEAFQPGHYYIGGSFSLKPGEPKTGWVYALNGVTGKVDWSYHATSPIIAGVTPTAGGLVFTGNVEGELLVFEAKTGKLLKNQYVGGSMAGGVISYAVSGKQYIAVAAGNISRVGFYTAKATPRVIVMTTGLESTRKSVVVDAVPPDEPSILRPGPQQGRMIFAQYCSICHGASGVGGSGGPPLLGEAKRKKFNQLVRWLDDPLPPMPKLHPEPLNDHDIRAVARYVEGLQ
jgi:alcohol dehydrogenase (cytochrome c)